MSKYKAYEAAAIANDEKENTKKEATKLSTEVKNTKEQLSKVKREAE